MSCPECERLRTENERLLADCRALVDLNVRILEVADDAGRRELAAPENGKAVPDVNRRLADELQDARGV